MNSYDLAVKLRDAAVETGAQKVLVGLGGTSDYMKKPKKLEFTPGTVFYDAEGNIVSGPENATYFAVVRDDGWRTVTKLFPILKLAEIRLEVRTGEGQHGADHHGKPIGGLMTDPHDEADDIEDEEDSDEDDDEDEEDEDDEE